MTKTKELGTKPISSLLLQYSVPAVIAMLVNAIYNVVDRVFIAKFTGELALAGLTISFPIMMLIFAFAGLVGAGGVSLISIRLGEKDKSGADHVFTNVLVISLIVGVIVALGVFFNLELLIKLCGADESVLPYASSYMKIILLGINFQLISFSLNNIVRAEGEPKLAMIAMISSAIANIILDYLFIGLFGWGVKGAALATIIGQFVGFAILVSYYLRGKGVLKFHMKDMMPDFKLVGKIFSIGAATFFGTLGTSVSAGLLNTALQNYGGNAAITSMGAINSLYTIFIMPIMGMQQGLQPIIGYNYGANLLSRVKKALGMAMVVAVGFSTVVFAIMEIFSSTVIQLFISQESPTMSVAVNGLRLFIIMLPVVSINILGAAYFQSVANAKVSLFLGISRQVIFLIPAILILPNLLELNGVWISTPVADGLSVVTTILFLIPVFRKNDVVNNLEVQTN